MNTRQLFAKRLRVLRAAANLNQEAVAERVGVSPSAIGTWERGDYEPPLSDLVSLARMFDVSLDYLGGLTDYPHGLAPDQWIIDLDELDVVLESGPTGRTWCAKVPRRHSIVDYDEMRALESRIQGSPKQKRRKKAGGNST